MSRHSSLARKHHNAPPLLSGCPFTFSTLTLEVEPQVHQETAQLASIYYPRIIIIPIIRTLES
jgi:hypothetical protein